MKERLVLIGGGGHARVLMELISLSDSLEVEAVLDPNLAPGTFVSGIKVAGGDGLLPGLFSRGVRYACVAVGSVKDNTRRASIYKKLKEAGFSLPRLMHPKAFISGSADINEGAQVMAAAVVQAGSSIGANTIVNSGAIVEHDCRIGNHVHLSPGSVISGGSVIEEGAFVGAGATVIQGVRVGERAIIAAGAVAVGDVAPGVLVKGVPAA
ncbi:MAG: acetyltransferase [Thermodesulfobacteriota bacterium]|nr:MAG: acetyltransferase [Thermodesulfobacteriota bacterium]